MDENIWGMKTFGIKGFGEGKIWVRKILGEEKFEFGMKTFGASRVPGAEAREARRSPREGWWMAENIWGEKDLGRGGKGFGQGKDLIG